jgi:uncharacterized protein YecE (DUF72 family)
MRIRPVAIFALLACGPGARAQQAAPWVDPQTAAIFTRISQHAARVEPMLQQVRASDWVAKGAAETYVAQLTGARQQNQAVQSDMAELSLHPDRLQDSMKALFRVQAFHRSLDSLMGGLRKYQNPALADLIQSVAAEDQADLDALQNHILELANAKEQEFQVADNEAQRCRAGLSRQPAASSPKNTRRTNP